MPLSMDNILNYYKKDLEELYKDITLLETQHYDNKGEKKDLFNNPHVNLLIEAFSLLHSNIKIYAEDSFIKFISHIFDRLYPHYNVPIPSISVIEIILDSKSTKPIFLPKGQVLDLRQNENICIFQTCYTSYLIPIKIHKAACRDIETLPFNTDLKDINSVISIQLRSYDKTEINALNIDKIRFFIQGFKDVKYQIYKTLMNDTTTITISKVNDYEKYILIDKSNIRKVGFSNDEALFPYNPNSFIGYRALTELFAFPDKFLFFDLYLEDNQILKTFTDHLEIRFYHNNPQLNGEISAENFALNVTPIINLFKKESEPILITPNQNEYPIIIDNYASNNFEVYSVLTANMQTNGKKKEGYSIFNINYYEDAKASDIFWYYTDRKPIKHYNDYLKASELYISIISEDNFLSKNKNDYLYLLTKCFNSNIPFQITSQGSYQFAFTDRTLPISNINCLIKPSPVIQVIKDRDQQLNMIAHLSVHYLTNMSNTNGKELIKEILSMYDFKQNSLNETLVESIIDVKIQEAVKRIKINNTFRFCKGTIVEIYFDEKLVSEGVLYLFTSILEYFVGMYCSINSFVQLITKGANNNILFQGVPRNGLRCVI